MTKLKATGPFGLFTAADLRRAGIKLRRLNITTLDGGLVHQLGGNCPTCGTSLIANPSRLRKTQRVKAGR